MSARLNPVWRWLLGALLAGGICLVIVDQNAVARLRAEQQTLSAEVATARRVDTGGPDLATLRAENEEVKRLELATKDLPRLRNGIGRLRAGAAELEKLRAENRRLTAQRDHATSASAPSAPPDFIARDALNDAGLATPEAAVQTVFSAMTRGNFERVVQCMANPGEFAVPPTEEARKQMMDEMAKFPGFRITGTINNSPTEAQVEIQTSTDGTVMGILVVRIGNEWKVSKMGL